MLQTLCAMIVPGASLLICSCISGNLTSPENSLLPEQLPETSTIRYITLRSNKNPRMEPFNPARIHVAVKRAAESSTEVIPVGRIVKLITDEMREPEIEKVQGKVKDTLKKLGYTKTANHYDEYMNVRETRRQRAQQEKTNNQVAEQKSRIQFTNEVEALEKLFQTYQPDQEIILPEFLYLWHKAATAEKSTKILNGDQTVHMLTWHVRGRRSAGLRHEEVTQRVMFFTDKVQEQEVIVYGMICEEYPEQKNAYLAFIERAIPKEHDYSSRWVLEYIIRAYADFLAVCFKHTPEEPFTLHIWPDPPTEKEDYCFLFRKRQESAKKLATSNSTASLAQRYTEMLSKTHVEHKMALVPPPLPVLPQLGLRGSRDLSFKANAEIMDLDAQRRSHYHQAQISAEKLEEIVHSNALSFILYPPLSHPELKLTDNTPWKWSDWPWPREKFKNTYYFDEPEREQTPFPFELVVQPDTKEFPEEQSAPASNWQNGLKFSLRPTPPPPSTKAPARSEDSPQATPSALLQQLAKTTKTILTGLRKEIGCYSSYPGKKEVEVPNK